MFHTMSVLQLTMVISLHSCLFGNENYFYHIKHVKLNELYSYYLTIPCYSDIRCGQWYDVSVSNRGVILEKRTDLLQRAEVRVCAFDIETTKLPLKFPDADYDLVMMISYMVDGQGYLIINREVYKISLLCFSNAFAC